MDIIIIRTFVIPTAISVNITMCHKYWRVTMKSIPNNDLVLPADLNSIALLLSSQMGTMSFYGHNVFKPGASLNCVVELLLQYRNDPHVKKG